MSGTSTVTLAFKCSVIGANGQVDHNSHKFLTWSYNVHEDVKTKKKTFSQCGGNSLGPKVLSVYSHLVKRGEATQIIYVDENNDRITIPCDNVYETIPVLKVIYKGDLEEQQSHIRIFIQLVSPSAPATGNCSCGNHDLQCSICKTKLKNEFVYKCLQCENTVCGFCDNKHAVEHPEHVVIRFVGGKHPNCLPEMKQLLSVEQQKPEVD